MLARLSISSVLMLSLSVACSDGGDPTAEGAADPGSPDAGGAPASPAGASSGAVDATAGAGATDSAGSGGASPDPPGTTSAGAAGVAAGGSPPASGGASSGGSAGAGGSEGTPTCTNPIPRPLGLWVLDDHNIPEAQWGDYSRWYSEEDGVRQIFRLSDGDHTLRGDGVTQYARIEVHSGLEFNPGPDWYVFEATYRISTELGDDIAIAQLFEYSQVHPQIIFIFKEANVVTFQPRGEGNRELGRGYQDRPFTIKMRSNGYDSEVYFNGELRYSGSIAYSEPGARNGFRWGLYYGSVVPMGVHSEVTCVTREQE